MRISDWSSDVCSSDLYARRVEFDARFEQARRLARHDHADVDELLALDPRYRADHRVVIDGRGHGSPPRRMHRAGAAARGDGRRRRACTRPRRRSEEQTAELQSLMRIPYAGFCFKKKKERTS